MNLTQHFSLEELTHTGTGIENTPNDQQIENLKKLAQLLEQIRIIVGRPIIINSAFRSKDVNIAAGGKKTSAHLDGYAADIRISGMTNIQICKAIYEAGIKFDQMIDENSKGGQWVHISCAPTMRQQWLIFMNGNYEVSK